MSNPDRAENTAAIRVEEKQGMASRKALNSMQELVASNERKLDEQKREWGRLEAKLREQRTEFRSIQSIITAITGSKEPTDDVIIASVEKLLHLLRIY